MEMLVEAARELRARQREYLEDPPGQRSETKGRLVGFAADRLDEEIDRYDNRIVLGNSREEFQDAELGIANDGRVIYSFDLLVEHFVNQDMEADEAAEWIHFNIVSLPYVLVAWQ